jgi:hypothetical protein
MSEPKNKMSKEQYEMLKAAAKRSIKREIQVKSVKSLKSLMDAEAANKDNERRRGFKPSGFPMYGKGGKMEMKEYKFGGKIYKDGGLALFKALKKKFGES